ncbi:hypothetical protein DDV21_002640 [Streptococcus chenjunshii]|uniref:Uncharacterized protein n=1 Tax=Streptococcus chenjunshii TaxID=2173853 RepID=A0A372KIP6_9STRE|nr:hypothetical protein [Streptococcus chenjunshii]AXQ78045.1 hypothetical protein DDV21_002640 [Streptococcus chenjunshii]RFU49926.1 hypothetical protein DDV22_11370 [Streptococcus chenjunshii]RFU52133.1 hypothetical protein DDV23_11315 [Streptococcus chenjunshii]
MKVTDDLDALAQSVKETRKEQERLAIQAALAAKQGDWSAKAADLQSRLETKASDLQTLVQGTLAGELADCFTGQAADSAAAYLAEWPQSDFSGLIRA